jgi:hypothetical protein
MYDIFVKCQPGPLLADPALLPGGYLQCFLPAGTVICTPEGLFALKNGLNAPFCALIPLNVRHSCWWQLFPFALPWASVWAVLFFSCVGGFAFSLVLSCLGWGASRACVRGLVTRPCLVEIPCPLPLVLVPTPLPEKRQHVKSPRSALRRLYRASPKPPTGWGPPRKADYGPRYPFQ